VKKRHRCSYEEEAKVLQRRSSQGALMKKRQRCSYEEEEEKVILRIRGIVIF
jgi:hypothetical protein